MILNRPGSQSSIHNYNTGVHSASSFFLHQPPSPPKSSAATMTTSIPSSQIRYVSAAGTILAGPVNYCHVRNFVAITVVEVNVASASCQAMRSTPTSGTHIRHRTGNLTPRPRTGHWTSRSITGHKSSSRAVFH